MGAFEEAQDRVKEIFTSAANAVTVLNETIETVEKDEFTYVNGYSPTLEEPGEESGWESDVDYDMLADDIDDIRSNLEMDAMHEDTLSDMIDAIVTKYQLDGDTSDVIRHGVFEIIKADIDAVHFIYNKVDRALESSYSKLSSVFDGDDESLELEPIIETLKDALSSLSDYLTLSNRIVDDFDKVVKKYVSGYTGAAKKSDEIITAFSEATMTKLQDISSQETAPQKLSALLSNMLEDMADIGFEEDDIKYVEGLVKSIKAFIKVLPTKFDTRFSQKSFGDDIDNELNAVRSVFIKYSKSSKAVGSKSRFKIGQEVVVLSSKRIGQIVNIRKDFTGKKTVYRIRLKSDRSIKEFFASQLKKK